MFYDILPPRIVYQSLNFIVYLFLLCFRLQASLYVPMPIWPRVWDNLRCTGGDYTPWTFRTRQLPPIQLAPTQPLPAVLLPSNHFQYHLPLDFRICIRRLRNHALIPSSGDIIQRPHEVLLRVLERRRGIRGCGVGVDELDEAVDVFCRYLWTALVVAATAGSRQNRKERRHV